MTLALRDPVTLISESQENISTVDSFFHDDDDDEHFVRRNVNSLHKRGCYVFVLG